MFVKSPSEFAAASLFFAAPLFFAAALLSDAAPLVDADEAEEDFFPVAAVEFEA